MNMLLELDILNLFTVSALGFASAFIEYVTIESYPLDYITNNEYPDINPITKNP